MTFLSKPIFPSTEELIWELKDLGVKSGHDRWLFGDRS
jgi:hypothetical protein